VTQLPWFAAAQIAEVFSMRDAIDVLERTLADGFDPADDPARSVVEVAHGQLLLMPSEAALDAETLTPTALLDGIALTSLRTPAMSAVAARYLAARDCTRLVVFGAGPQAVGHVAAIRSVRGVDDVVIVGRDQARAQALAARINARTGTPGDVATADIVVCATTATQALFDGALVRSNACVIAVGSHQPQVRELDATLMRRADVVVEDRVTALREAGDVILADLVIDDLIAISDVVTGAADLAGDRPRVFKSVGMAWEDLAVAAAIVARVS
jgi:ornithine cyclodeaminase/alanine dehydrogenase-like protein (mu-crystallin family)